MSFIRHLRRERVYDEFDERPRRRWERASKFGRVRLMPGRWTTYYTQLVWGPDAPITRKGRRDLWIVSGVIFALTVALLIWSL